MRDDEDDQPTTDAVVKWEVALVVACMIIGALAILWRG